MVLLAESHLAVHTWPALAGVTMDADVCNLHADHGARAEALMAQLHAAFAAGQAHAHAQRVDRGWQS